MADLQSYKKADLVNFCKKLEISTLAKDTKKVLIEKIEEYIKDHPEDGESTVRALIEVKEEEEEEEEEDGDEATLAEESSNSEESEEVDAQDEDEDNGEDDDKDYEDGPPINLKEWVVDPVIEKGEVLLSKLYEFTDSVGITTVEFNETLREKLSTSVTLNYLELIVEVFHFLYVFVSCKPLFEHTLIPSEFRNIGLISKFTTPFPDVSRLFKFETASIFFTWALTSIILPLVLSYYINFSKRVIFVDDEGFIGRVFKYDPFTFALSKILILYFFISGSDSLISLSSKEYTFCIINCIAKQVSNYGVFLNSFGTFPFVLGLANVAIAIYSQFEEY